MERLNSADDQVQYLAFLWVSRMYQHALTLSTVSVIFHMPERWVNCMATLINRSSRAGSACNMHHHLPTSHSLTPLFFTYEISTRLSPPRVLLLCSTCSTSYFPDTPAGTANPSSESVGDCRRFFCISNANFFPHLFALFLEHSQHIVPTDFCNEPLFWHLSVI